MSSAVEVQLAGMSTNAGVQTTAALLVTTTLAPGEVMVVEYATKIVVFSDLPPTVSGCDLISGSSGCWVFRNNHWGDWRDRRFVRVTADTEAKVVHEVACTMPMANARPGAFNLEDHISEMTCNRGDCVLDVDALAEGTNELMHGVVDSVSWSSNRTATLTVETQKHMEINEHVSRAVNLGHFGAVTPEGNMMYRMGVMDFDRFSTATAFITA
jgi:hypothetical protein